MVQSELHPEDEGREGDRNPSEPNPDAPAARVPEAVTPEVGSAAHAEVALPLQIHDNGGAIVEPPALQLERAPAEPPRAGFVDQPPSWGGPTPPAPIADTPRLTSPGIRLSQVKDELVAWVKTLLSAAVYAVLIVTFGFQVARVEGQSMAPTLEDQDRLIVNKLVYRIGEPRRGDIVMLYYPLNPEKSFVKRVIAEEGDTVRIVDGRVYVNDIPLKDDYVPSEFRSHDDWGPQVIPEGYYFVMGDHRNNSSDSRHWGMVPKKYIIGKVQLRWWPVPTARVF